MASRICVTHTPIYVHARAGLHAGMYARAPGSDPAHLDAHNALAQQLFFDLGQKKTPLNGGASCVHHVGSFTHVHVRGFAEVEFKVGHIDKFIDQFSANIFDIKFGFGLFRVRVHVTRKAQVHMCFRAHVTH